MRGFRSVPSTGLAIRSRPSDRAPAPSTRRSCTGLPAPLRGQLRLCDSRLREPNEADGRRVGGPPAGTQAMLSSCIGGRRQVPLIC